MAIVGTKNKETCLVINGDKIGGHDGLSVYRTAEGILKQVNMVGANAESWYDMNMKGIQNEARFLRELAGTGYAPKLLDVGEDWILEEDLGASETPTVIQPLMRSLCWMLHLFRCLRIRHIDLTWPNVVVRENHPYALDFQQSRFYDESANSQERWATDTGTVWQWMSQTKDTRGVADESRIIRRWAAVLGALGCQTRLTAHEGKTFLDLGCFQGDMVGMARCEGMEAEGVDFGGFRTGEDSIEIAKALWGWMNCKFTKHDIMELETRYFKRDVVVMFSTWPYIVHKHGKYMAEAVLEQVIRGADVFFFETQLYGDGPGPEFLAKDDDVANMLASCGAGTVKPLINIPVYGRPTSRTVWQCTR